MDLFIWVYSILPFPFSKFRPPPPLLKFQLKFQRRHYLWGNVGVCALVKLQLFGIIRNSNSTLLLFEDIYRYLQLSIFSIIILCGATRNVTETIEFQHDFFSSIPHFWKVEEDFFTISGLKEQRYQSLQMYLASSNSAWILHEDWRMLNFWD